MMADVVDYEPRNGRPKPWIRKRFILGAGALVAIILLARSGFFTGDHFCCSLDEIDTVTGRIQHTRYLLYCKISESVEDSLLTKALGTQTPQWQTPDWQPMRINITFSNARVDYALGGVPGQIHEIEDIWELRAFIQQAKYQVARNVLYVWHRYHDYRIATMYIEALSDLALQNDSVKRGCVDIGDLPAAPK